MKGGMTTSFLEKASDGVSLMRIVSLRCARMVMTFST
jgi:hypothetical protein